MAHDKQPKLPLPQGIQSKIFPNCSILDDKVSTIGSYACKSILGARDVIRRGMVWRIGNGQDVRIKEDRWLPIKSNRTAISPLNSVQPKTKVCFLINHELGMWKSNVVERPFLPYEASLILGIPLSFRMPPDDITWGLTPNGIFSKKKCLQDVGCLG